MSVSEELKRAAEMAGLYSVLAKYFEYRDPQAHFYYYSKHFQYAARAAELAARDDPPPGNRVEDTRVEGGPVQVIPPISPSTSPHVDLGLNDAVDGAPDMVQISPIAVHPAAANPEPPVVEAAAAPAKVPAPATAPTEANLQPLETAAATHPMQGIPLPPQMEVPMQAAPFHPMMGQMANPSAPLQAYGYPPAGKAANPIGAAPFPYGAMAHNGLPNTQFPPSPMHGVPLQSAQGPAPYGGYGPFAPPPMGPYMVNPFAMPAPPPLGTSPAAVHAAYDPSAPHEMNGPGSHMQDAPRDTARVRAIHTIADAPAVDVYVNGQKLLNNIAYKASTNFITVPSGTYQIDVFPSGSTGEAAILSESVTIAPGAGYTLAAAGTLENPRLLVYSEELQAPPGSVRVRFIQLSPDAPPVDIATRSGNVLFPNVNFRDATRYATVAPGTYTLSVREAGTDRVLFTVPSTRLTGGHVYSIVITGFAGSTPGLEAKVLRES